MAWIAALWSSLLPLTRTSMKMATTWGMCEILSGRKGKHKMVGKGVQERLQQERREEEHSLTHDQLVAGKLLPGAHLFNHPGN